MAGAVGAAAAAPLRTPFPAFRFMAHQESGVRWMLSREAPTAAMARGGVLADDMGLGKSWMAVGLMLNGAAAAGPRRGAPTLLVAPPALIPHWCDVLAQAGVPHAMLQAVGVAGGRGYRWQPQACRAAREDDRAAVARVLLVTYDRAARPAAGAAILAAGPYARMVLDEGHVLRNGPGTRRFDALARVDADCRWLLTGTPIQNRVGDFRNLLAFLRCAGDGGPDAEAEGGEEGAAEDAALKPLRAAAATLMLRRQMAALRGAIPGAPRVPPRHVVTHIAFPPGSQEESWFRSLEARFRAAAARAGNALNVLELYLRVQQFLAHPEIYHEAMRRKYPGEWPPYTGSATRFAAFTALLEAEPAAPSVVFTRFRREAAYAAAALAKRGYRVWFVQGGMTRGALAAAVAESRAAVEGGAAAVALVVQLQAGAAGLNLQHCHRVVFLAEHYNPSVGDQAVARAHRIGQRHPVVVHHFLLADGSERNMDRLVLAMHATKRAAAASVCAGLATECALPDVEGALEALQARIESEEDARIDGEEAGEGGEDPVPGPALAPGPLTGRRRPRGDADHDSPRHRRHPEEPAAAAADPVGPAD